MYRYAIYLFNIFHRDIKIDIFYTIQIKCLLLGAATQVSSLRREEIRSQTDSVSLLGKWQYGFIFAQIII